MSPAKIDPQLAAKLKTRSSQDFALIVRVVRADDATEQALRSLGLVVRHRLTLTPIFAVTGPAPAALRLIDQPWVVSVEEDLPVHTM